MFCSGTFPSLWGFQWGGGDSPKAKDIAQDKFSGLYCFTEVAAWGTVNLRGCRLSFIFTHKRSRCWSPVKTWQDTRTVHKITLSSCFLSRAIFTSRPLLSRLTVSTRPLKMKSPAIVISISREWIILVFTSVFTACSGGQYDQRQIFLSTVSHLRTFCHTVSPPTGGGHCQGGEDKKRELNVSCAVIQCSWHPRRAEQTPGLEMAL